MTTVAAVTTDRYRVVVEDGGTVRIIGDITSAYSAALNAAAAATSATAASTSATAAATSATAAAASATNAATSATAAASSATSAASSAAAAAASATAAAASETNAASSASAAASSATNAATSATSAATSETNAAASASAAATSASAAATSASNAATAMANLGDGSAAAPVVSFAADTNSGFYRIGANNIGAAVNGAKVLDIATTGLSVTGALSATGNATVSRLIAGGTSNWPTTSIGNSAGRHILNGSTYPMLVLWNEEAASGADKAEIHIGAKTGLGAATYGGGRLKGGLANASDAQAYLDLQATNSSGYFATPAIRISGKSSAVQSAVLIGTTTDNGNDLLQVAGKASIANLLDLSGAAAGQIKFPATQNASSDANTLDDYEEGTWTPTDASGAGLSITGFDCKYTKVGRLVTLSGSLVYPVTASGANAKVAVPFTPGQQKAVGAAAGVSANVSSYTAPADAGLYFITNTGGAVQTNATLSGSNVLVTITYSV